MNEHEILRVGRKALGLHQYGFAHMIGITQSYLSHLELGRRPITDDLLARMPPAIREPLARARIAELEKLLPPDTEHALAATSKLYLAAVSGRREFRAAYKAALAENRRLRDAMDRIARFADAYDNAAAEKGYPAENVGSALCVTLGRYARRELEKLL